jgi:hypothetical protein
MELLSDNRAFDRALGASYSLAGRFDRDLFVDHAGNVLRPVYIANLGFSRHNHGGWTVFTSQPGPLGVGNFAVLIVEHILAEIPDRAIVSLSVPVKRDLLDAPVEIGNVLGNKRLNLLAIYFNNLGLR